MYPICAIKNSPIPAMKRIGNPFRCDRNQSPAMENKKAATMNHAIRLIFLSGTNNRRIEQEADTADWYKYPQPDKASTAKKIGITNNAKRPYFINALLRLRLGKISN